VVLEAIVQAFPKASTIASLAETLQLHVNTVREHLEWLTQQELVRRAPSLPAGRGRPPQLFEPVPRDADGDSEYVGLAAALAGHISRTSPQPAVDAVEAGSSWGRQLAQRSGRRRASSPTAARRQVNELLDDMGFAPEADARATDVRLTRCPLLETALRYPDVVCGVHLGIAQGALAEFGGDPERTALLPFAEPGACRLHLLKREATP
jgi:predicted ArsR family transcriptional regulator